MRPLILTFLTLLLPAGVVCQTPSENSLDAAVRELLGQQSNLVLLEGPTEKVLSRSGDSAAVAITKIIGGRDLTANEIDRTLLVLNRSFAAPRIIENESDRQPRTALFVLKYLSSLPVTPELKQRIAETRTFVERSAGRAASAER
jgi:hypothetical protein